MNLILKIILILTLSIGSAILYRLGGSSPQDQDKEFPWIPRWFKNIPKKRDVMSNLLILAGAMIIGVKAPFLAWFACFGLLWASLSSYWDWMFGYDNFWFHGFMCAFSILPLVIWGNLGFVPFFVRSIFAALSVGGWSLYHGNATTEELGRGFLLCISNILLKLF